MIPAALVLLLLAVVPANAQPAPQVSVTRDPDGPVTVGTPVRVTATILVPTWMPEPPVWPDLEIADAITRLPERATRPVTSRIGRDSWSGLARTWEITPQRPADYDIGPAPVTVTWADPDTSAPTETALALPPVTFSATVPPGAEGIDPFLAATRLSVTATLDGLPDAPKPGDAFTLTLATTASGPSAMLLPPLAERLPSLDGLRAYPREPVLADGDPATRTETVAYVIEAPGRFVLPPVTLDWWNTATSTRETATTDPVTIDVATPPGWRSGDASAPVGRRTLVAAAAALVVLAVALAVAVRHGRGRGSRPPSERSRYRALRRSIRHAPPPAIRRAFDTWRGPAGVRDPDVESALLLLERAVYGAAPDPRSEAEARSRLLSASARARSRGGAHGRGGRESETPAALPPLNPAFLGEPPLRAPRRAG